MSSKTKELKSLLHESIENINDEAFLQTIKQVLDHKYQPEKDITLTPYQEKRIDQAKKNLEEGNYLTNEQADQIIAKWLNE